MDNKTIVPFVDFPASYQKIKPEIDAAIQRVLNKGEFILKDEVEQFEKELADYLKVKYVIGVNSGTDALFLSLRALGIGPGDEVITVSHTFVATIEAIVHNGATPILVDIDENYLMDMEQVKKAITPRTKAIIPVHLSGDVCAMDTLKEIIRPFDIVIIEDAAQALGAELNSQKAGSMGITGCFSFYPAKILGSFGDAGAVATDNRKVANKIRALRNHSFIGKNLDVADQTITYGFNSRLDNLQAAVLRVKLKHIGSYIADRKIIANVYDKELADLDEVVLPRTRPVYQDYVIRAKKRDELAGYLTNLGIDTHRLGLFGPIPNHKYKGLNLNFSLPKTEAYIGEWLRLPCNPEMSVQDAELVAKNIKEFYA